MSDATSPPSPPAKPRIRLDPDEAWAMIEAAHTGIFTTLRRDGTPIALPVWFVTLDRRIYVTTPARAKKVARVQHDGRASFLVESGLRWAELTAVHLTGTADVLGPDDPLAARITEASDAKYDAFRTKRRDMPDSTKRHYGAAGAFIRFVPDERFLSWDNARLGPG